MSEVLPLQLMSLPETILERILMEAAVGEAGRLYDFSRLDERLRQVYRNLALSRQWRRIILGRTFQQTLNRRLLTFCEQQNSKQQHNTIQYNNTIQQYTEI